MFHAIHFKTDAVALLLPKDLVLIALKTVVLGAMHYF
jgi:hypothetical protein